MDRFSEYRIMWVFVFFDLPTETAKERKDAADFRKKLIQDGFTMFQFSAYIRPCPTCENAEVHVKRVKKIMPPKGEIAILMVTDKQFGSIELFSCKKEKKKPDSHFQLELF